MGFFDLNFLMGPQQDPKMTGGPAGQPKGELELMQEAAKKIRARQASEAESKFMRERSKSGKFALQEALSQVPKISRHISIKKAGAGGEVQSEVDEGKPITDELKAARDPRDYSRILERHAKKWGMDTSFLDPVDEAVSQYIKLSKRPEAAGITERIAGQDLETLQREERGLGAQQEELEGGLRDVPSERAGKKLQSRIDAIKGARQERTLRIGDVQKRLGATAKPQVVEPQTGQPVPTTDLNAALRGFNLPRRDLSQSINDMAKETAQSTGKPIDMNAQIDPRAAFQMLLHNSPEFAETMSKWARARKAQEQSQQPEGPVGPDEGAALDQAQLDLKMNRLALDQKRRELFESRPFQSWHSVLAFAILSILSDNPQMMFQLFMAASQNGTLEGWIEDLRSEGKYLEERVIQETRIAEGRRSRAAARQEGLAKEGRDQARAMQLAWYKSRLAIQEAAKKAEGTEMEDIYKKGVKEFDQVSAEIGKVLQILTADDLRVSEEQKAWAQKEFQRLYPRMEQLRKTFGITGQ